MKKAVAIFILSVFSLQSFAQVKIIKGIIYDDYTNYHIKNVLVSPSPFDSVLYSTDRGRFKIILPSNYKDTLVFSHPDYYPFVKRVQNGAAMKLFLIRLIPRTYRLDTICYIAYKENVWLQGRVIDELLEESVRQAEIRLENNDIVAYSDRDGEFDVAIPKSNKNLIISHPDFNTAIVPIEDRSRRQPGMVIKLCKKNLSRKDTAWKYRNNLVAFSVGELLNGGIGLRYERSIKQWHSIGLHLTSYFFGFSWPMLTNSMTNDRFTGLKIAPFYHFYVWKNVVTAGFVEVKPLLAYFNFYSLDYAMKYEPEYEYNVSTNFWTGGVGIAWGWLFYPSKNNFSLCLSAGIQYFPWNVPKTIKNEEGATYEINKTWWYIGGPGSVIEIKILIGGRF